MDEKNKKFEIKMNGDKPITAIIGVKLDQRPDKSFIGLTKREHFAGLALQGFISSTKGQIHVTNACKWSVGVADKLLKALEE